MNLSLADSAIRTADSDVLVRTSELSALAENGEGEPMGENFEVIFQGKEGEVSEVFAGYKVTDENGDEMIYYKRESP